jgi:uncharacterized protein YkwD
MQTISNASNLIYLCLILCVFLMVSTPVFATDELLARQVLAEINLARTKPSSYAAFVREFRTQFRGKQYLQPGRSVRVQTTEGVAAVDQAASFLMRQKKLPPLVWSDGLAKASSELAEEQAVSGATGHISSDGRGPKERIERYGTWERQMAENIGYGPDTAREMVLQLIVDDGVKSRGHRRNIFTAGFGTAGVACDSHPRFGTACVIDFAGGFRE